MQLLKQKIIAESKRLGIDKIGFTSAEPFFELEEPLIRQKEAGHNSGFEHQNIAERIDIRHTHPNAQSIIAIALAYPTEVAERQPRDEKRGKFARVSWGIDYHEILNQRLEKLMDFIRQQAETQAERESWDFAPQVDTGELVDVAVAQRAGLGFVGRNGLLITEEFGSFVYLGEIVTNLAFPCDAPKAFGCGDCQRCLTKCPTKALLPEGGMNAKRCLSYQTQTKELMPEEFRSKMSNVIYGCDICQLVCPYNKGKNFHFHPEMEPKVDEVYPKLRPLLTISNREFKEQFGHLSGAWRGKKPIQRNALIALANLGDRAALPLIHSCLLDPRPVIRGTAAWSISKLAKKNPQASLTCLQSALESETDESVRHELMLAVNRLSEHLSP